MASQSVNPKHRGYQVVANLVNDPELIEAKNGNKMVVFRIAENHRAWDRETGEWNDTGATYYDVAVSESKRHLAQNVLGSLKQGNRVSVTGTYDAVPYVAADGSVGMNYRIMADDVSASLAFNQVRIGPSAANVASASSSATAQADSPAAAADTDFDASM